MEYKLTEKNAACVIGHLNNFFKHSTIQPDYQFNVFRFPVAKANRYISNFHWMYKNYKLSPTVFEEDGFDGPIISITDTLVRDMRTSEYVIIPIFIGQTVIFKGDQLILKLSEDAILNINMQPSKNYKHRNSIYKFKHFKSSKPFLHHINGNKLKPIYC